MNDLWRLIRARHGAPPQWPVAGIDALQPDWDYRPSRPGAVATMLRWRARTIRRGLPPPSRVLKPTTPRRRWSAAFLYLADGRLTAAHGYMLDRLRARDAGLLVVCATPAPADVPARLRDIADALIWKGLAGFDFSAYALALDAVATGSPGADLLVVNDSVLGPFGDIDATLATMPWDFAGFTASGQYENHVQSYAFHLRGLDPARAAALAPTVSTRFAYERYRDVIFAQETRLARVAARTMSVGALWCGPAAMGDPSVHAAPALVRRGFPFLKRKLFDRDAGVHPRAALLALLEEHGHPRP